jgi:hypothetical protein
VIGDVGVNSVVLTALEAPVFESITEWSENGSPFVPLAESYRFGTN